MSDDLLQAIIDEQRLTNDLLRQMLQLLREGEPDQEAEAMTLDGSSAGRPRQAGDEL